ncbi:MAG: glucose 1-dehydrogenase [Pseudomonadota bacterium]
MTDTAATSGMRRFSGKSVLVTGGAAGIGRAVALEFAKEGANLIVADIDEAMGAECVDLVRQIGAEAEFIRADISQPDDVSALFAAIVASGTPLDIAINNAGIEGEVGLVEDQNDRNFDRVLAVNVQGTFQCMREEVRLMKPRGSGVIINFASIAAHVGFAGLSVYTASKAAVLAMTKSVALELAQSGVRVASVSPGLVQTAMLERFFAADANAKQQMTGSLPLGRPCDSYEVARGVLFLASDDASLVVGQTLNLDGGWAYVKS